tara:strand:+ start:5319 stop:8297 length:2979 start_codon:yes stop_codon:yes gene_type:complete
MRQKYQARILTMLFVLLMSTQLAIAQYTVTGTVTDEASGNLLIGVTIFDPGTGGGITTNLDGVYKISVPTGEATLRFSYIGYLTQNIEVSGTNGETVQLDVTLKSDIANLDELIVTGLASSTKRTNLANSVSSINADDISGKSDPPTLDAALQGKIPGVQIQSYSGAPGGGFNVQMRGVSTFGASGSQPLYIVDGVYVNNETVSTGRSSVSGAGGSSQDDTANRLADLNPDDIESIEVLKGSSAAAIYGQRANAGVIIIKTKRGKAGDTKISVSQDIGFSSALTLLGRTDWDEARIRDFWGTGTRGDLELQRYNDAKAAGNIKDMEEELYGGQGAIASTQVSVSGGSSNTRFYLSAGTSKEDGIVDKTGFERKTVRANLDHNISKTVRISSSSTFINSDSKRGFTGNQNNTGGSIGYSLANIPNYAYNILKQNADGTFNDNPYFTENPFRLINDAKNEQEVNRIIQSLRLDADLITEGVSRLSFSIQGGVDYLASDGFVYFPEYMQYQRTAATDPGDVLHSTSEVMNLNFQSSLVFNTEVSSDAGTFYLSTQTGLTRFDQRISSDNIRGQGLLPGQTNVGNAAKVSANQSFTEITDLGYFAQQEVNWDDKVIGTVGGRLDRSTLNVQHDQLYFYPKASVAANLTNFDFWSFEKISQFKLRVAYGVTGGLPNFGNIFTSANSENIGTSVGISAGGSTVDPDLKPESANELEYGLDIAMLDGRIAFEGTFYNKTVEDLILNLNPAPSTGLGGVSTNAATLENKGIELGLTVIPVQSTNLNWTSSLLWWKNESNITELNVPASISGAFSTSFGFAKIEEGVSPTTIFGFDGDGNEVIFGNYQPDFQMSLANNINFFKNFDASFMLHWNKGSELTNLSDLLSDGRGNTDDYYSSGTTRTVRPAGTARYVDDGSYIKLREASLYYTVPREILSEKMGNVFSRIKVGVSGTNLLMFTDYGGYDPEVSALGRSNIGRQVDITPYPSSRKILFNIKFDIN